MYKQDKWMEKVINDMLENVKNWYELPDDIVENEID